MGSSVVSLKTIGRITMKLIKQLFYGMSDGIKIGSEC